MSTSTENQIAMRNSESQPEAWVCGSWEPLDRAGLAHDDLGALQGAVIVERLRTVGGRLLDTDLHLKRLVVGVDHIQVQLPSRWDVTSIADEVARRAVDLLQTDVSVVIVVTPGRVGGDAPTLVVHASPIPWNRLVAWYRGGQRVVTARNRNVPSACWPIQLKNRSRMHYFLADQNARQFAESAGQSGARFAGGLLCDLAGNLTETSTANVLLLEGESLVSPPMDSILDGISLKRTVRLARELGMRVEHAEVSPQRARSANALVLCGTLGCIWAAASLDNHEFDAADQNDLFSNLQKAWQDDIGLDFVAQAARQSE
ncbi:MAG: aminotransferase class IV [Aureliella sp.]